MCVLGERPASPPAAALPQSAMSSHWCASGVRAQAAKSGRTKAAGGAFASVAPAVAPASIACQQVCAVREEHVRPRVSAGSEGIGGGAAWPARRRSFTRASLCKGVCERVCAHSTGLLLLLHLCPWMPAVWPGLARWGGPAHESSGLNGRTRPAERRRRARLPRCSGAADGARCCRLKAQAHCVGLETMPSRRARTGLAPASSNIDVARFQPPVVRDSAQRRRTAPGPPTGPRVQAPPRILHHL